MKKLTKKIAALLVGSSCMAFAAGAIAGPAYPYLQNFKQANGASIQGRMLGDEHLHWMETAGGDVFLFNQKSGAYEYAVVDQTKNKNSLVPSGIAVGSGAAPALVTAPGVTSQFVVNALWRESSQKAAASPKLKSASVAKAPAANGVQAAVSTAAALPDVPLLVVLVDYSDNKIQSSDTSWQQKIFGSTEGAVNDYFREVSNGRFKYVPATESQGTANDGVVHISLNYPNPNPNDHGMDVNVLNDLFGKIDQYVNFAQYDKNDDGTIDPSELSLLFVLGGKESSYDGSNGIWAQLGGYYWSGNQKYYDNTRIRAFAAVGERHGDHEATIGVIAHELASLTFSLYDADQYSGNFSVWGRKSGDLYAGQTPTHMSAVHKIQAGFATPTEIDALYAPANLSLYAPKNAAYNIVKVATNVAWDYFLLEQRRLEGYDRGLTTDSTLYGKSGVMIYQASGADGIVVRANNVSSNSVPFALTDLYYPGNNTRLAPDTTPNSNFYGVNSKVVIENIASTADAMTLTVRRADPNGYFCKQYAATNSAHVTANRAYNTTTGTWFKTTTYYAKGSAQNLGTSGSTSTTLKEAPPGYFAKGTCTQTNQKPVIVAVYAETQRTVWAGADFEVSDAERDPVRMEVQLDGGAWNKILGLDNPDQGTFRYEARLGRLTSGNHQLNARAYDAAGNASAAYGPVTINVPAQSAPTCSFDSVTRDADGYFVAYGYVGDADGDLARMELRVDGGAWQRIYPDSYDYLADYRWHARTSPYPYGDPNGLSVGNHTAELRVTDYYSQTCNSALSFVVASNTSSPPVIKNVSSHFIGSTVFVGGDATDIDGDVATIEYDIDASGNWRPVEFFGIDESHRLFFSLRAENLSPGLRAFSLRAHDSAGHIGEYQVSVDLPAPAAPVCSFKRVYYEPSQNSYYLEGTISDVNNDAAGIEVSYNQSNWYPAYALGGDFQTQLPNQPLANGNYTVYGHAGDAAGLVSSCGSLAFTINGYGNPPTIGTPSVSVNGLSVTVSGTAADPDNDLAAIEVQFDSDTAAIANANGTGSWSLANSSLAAGTHKVRARAKDANGNSSAWSSWVNFTLAAPVSCFTATNSAHAAAGRATVQYNVLYYAVGSGTYLGIGSATTSLKLSSPNNWAKVTSCP